MSQRFVMRLLSGLLLLAALVLLVGLAMDLGQAGRLDGLSSAVPRSAEFAAGYLRELPGRYPYREEVGGALPGSLGLVAVALTLAVATGLPLALLAALRRRTRLSGGLIFLSVLELSTPSFFAAMLLVWLIVWLYREYGFDLIRVYGFGWDAHLTLPALVLAIRPAASIMRLGHNALVEGLDADHVRTAHAKGLRPQAVLLRHVLRNDGVPLLSTIVVSLRTSLAVSATVEYIFNQSGLGQRLLEALQRENTAMVVSKLLRLAVLFVLVVPRLRAWEGSAA